MSWRHTDSFAGFRITANTCFARDGGKAAETAYFDTLAGGDCIG
jgi:hypothetical protein